MSLHRCLVHALLPVVRRRALDVFNRSLFFKDWTTMVCRSTHSSSLAGWLLSKP